LNIENLIYISQSAGKILARYFRQKSISYKEKSGKSDLVTEADLASQEKITQDLAKFNPKIKIIGEEGPHNYQENKYFLVDPLDGTLNFFHGIPYFSVSISLMEGKDSIMGVVHAPILNETFYAIRGEGAYFNGNRLSLSDELALSKAIVATGWPYSQQFIRWTEGTINLVQARVQEVRILGSAALEMCYVAAGIIDAYWEVGLYPWDLAAGGLIVEEAKGILRDIDGTQFDLFSGRVLTSRNNLINDEMVTILSKIKKS